ncbi:hypothetical protein [Nonomuraea jiangxiensis]|uniref:Uncharacterized protein n=1 Tax=Nonomuraea jiangxiensis TaxID=633440 RepID=A0A1G8W3V7_9ACTN|nr:hypothetical protein [Nonomuraea jiangxiensis]SDJ72929.1 hypothetical protein SAMN05421869_11240 [Nonomuraea jiangxiensis]
MTQWSGGPNEHHRYGGPPGPPPAPYPGPPPPPHRRRGRGRVGVIAAVVVFVVLLAAGAAGLLVWQRFGGGGGPAAAAVDTSSLDVLKKSPLTTADLSKVDPGALFYASFRKAVTQPVLHITEESYSEAEDFEEGKPGYVWESGFDYRTKKWRMAWGSARPDDPLSYCRDGKERIYSFYSKDWRDPEPGWDDLCLAKRAYRYITDGILTGGLTGAQADAWIKELREEYQGFVHPGAPRLAEVKGRQYVRMVVDYKPVPRSGLYVGAQVLMWSFKTSGVDPDTHPYSYNGAMGTGYHVVTYLDPATLLPAYSEVEQTPVLDENGKPRTDSGYSKLRVEYHQPGRLPELKETRKPARPKLTWPRDKG